MPLSYAKHESISLRQHPEFSETWLHERIKDDTSILGLGELEVLKHEYIQTGGGRLDLLLADTENDVRYEVEIMLGPTDPSHIIRCIEYWDVERRRYPAYDHIAVLVAEEVTARFLNVISLLSGTIPLIAIQLNALRVGDNIVLNFVKVLDQRSLRVDVEAEAEGETADRATWENKVGSGTLQICDKIASIANEVSNPKLELKYKKGRIVLSEPGNFFNAIVVYPKKTYAFLQMIPSEREAWMQRLSDADLEPQAQKNGRLRIRVSSEQLGAQGTLLAELIHQVVKEHQAA
jgi:hypothetical protein